MTETATMAWRDSRQARRVVIYDLQGDESAFRAFMDNLRSAWDRSSLGVPLARHFRDQLRGRTLDVTVVREGVDDVYLVRPYAPIVGWFGDGIDPKVWHLSRVPKETPTETLCGELVGDPQIIIPMRELSRDAKRCERCVELADIEVMAGSSSR